MQQETLKTRMFELCDLVASWSKDKSRKTSAVIVRPDSGVVVSYGWNGFPRGVRDGDSPELTAEEAEARCGRPGKYKWTEHAERDAIYNLVRQILQGCEMYLPWYPCVDCARAIVQVGITTVHCVEPDWDDPAWAADFAITREMFDEAGVTVHFVDGRTAPVQSGA